MNAGVKTNAGEEPLIALFDIEPEDSGDVILTLDEAKELQSLLGWAINAAESPSPA